MPFLPLVSVKFQIYWSCYTETSLYGYIPVYGWINMTIKKNLEKTCTLLDIQLNQLFWWCSKDSIFYRSNARVKSCYSPGHKIAFLCAESAGRCLEFVQIRSLMALWFKKGSDSLLEYSAATWQQFLKYSSLKCHPEKTYLVFSQLSVESATCERAINRKKFRNKDGSLR